jgi:hypothetical protein
MITIKGIYENGQVKLLETPPVNSTNKVLITFIEEDEENDMRKLSFTQSTEEFKNYLEDSGEDIYQEYLKK